MVKRIIAGIVMLFIVLTMLTGCGEDTFTLERKLYYDMEDIYRYGLDFMDEMVKGAKANKLDYDALQGYIASLEDKVDGLKPPKHLKSEVNEWKSEIEGAISVFKQMADGGKELLSNSQLEAFDYGITRIYDGFKEFDWRK